MRRCERILCCSRLLLGRPNLLERRFDLALGLRNLRSHRLHLLARVVDLLRSRLREAARLAG
jgi:hypothetical protein